MKYTSILSVVFAIISFNVTSLAVADSATSDVRISGNIDPNSSIVVVPKDFADFSSVNIAQLLIPVRIYDSESRTHEIWVSFFHTALVSWTVTVFVDGKDVSKKSGKPISVGSATYTSTQYGELASINFSTTFAWKGAKKIDVVFYLDFTAFDNKSLVENIDVGPNSCSSTETVVDEAIESIGRLYISDGIPCRSKLYSYVITSQQLAYRAIGKRKCNTKKFSNSSDCKKCFNLAAKSIEQKLDPELFLGLISNARKKVAYLRDQTCIFGTAL